MTEVNYPEMIEKLPEINISIPGVVGRLMQAGNKQLVFFDIDPTGVVPPHSHGAQWGIVVDGEIELTIGGEAKIYTKGDSYYIPAGVVHSGRVIKQLKAIDIFDEPARYQPKP